MRRFAWLAALLALVACGRSNPGGPQSTASAASAAPAASVAPTAAPYDQPGTRPPPPRAGQIPSTFADLARHADPAVVFVATEVARVGRGRRVVNEGLGSGFVFDPEGLVLTNYHVIANATRIDVVFGEGNRKEAKVVGTDPRTDVAVLRVEGNDFPHLEFGDSSSVRVGDWVVAIGNPFGLSHTVSAGILSAKGRTHDDLQGGLDPAGYYDFLQTDASINPGNSGGPLLDLSGRVIGINTAIKPQANNIGFAIPIDMVEELLPSLIDKGRVQRSAIGIVVATARPEDVKRLGIASRTGAIVTQVSPGGPGDRAGLAVDDVILAWEGEKATSPHRLRWLASIAGVGRRVTLRVARGKRVFDLTVTLKELPEPPDVKERFAEIPFP